MDIRRYLADNFPDTLLADGFDSAIIGVTHDGRAVYDINTMIDELVKNDDMLLSEAVEYLEFNTLGAYVGDMTPVYVWILNGMRHE